MIFKKLIHKSPGSQDKNPYISNQTLSHSSDLQDFETALQAFQYYLQLLSFLACLNGLKLNIYVYANMFLGYLDILNNF